MCFLIVFNIVIEIHAVSSPPCSPSQCVESRESNSVAPLVGVVGTEEDCGVKK